MVIWFWKIFHKILLYYFIDKKMTRFSNNLPSRTGTRILRGTYIYIMAIVRIRHLSWTLLASLNPQKYIISVLRVTSRYLVTLPSVCWASVRVCVCVCDKWAPSGCTVNLELKTFEENGIPKFMIWGNFSPLKYVTLSIYWYHNKQKQSRGKSIVRNLWKFL